MKRNVMTWFVLLSAHPFHLINRQRLAEETALCYFFAWFTQLEFPPTDMWQWFQFCNVHTMANSLNIIKIPTDSIHNSLQYNTSL